MNIASDWHIHSRNSCDSASLVVRELLDEAGAKGIRDFGLTDHIHSSFNLPDLDKSRAEFDAASPSAHVHFGVEVSVMSTWEIERIANGASGDLTYGIRVGGPAGASLALGLTQTDKKRLGIEFVVGGTHWPMYVPFEREAIILDYHRQNMFLACHPMVDIVAHPWWWQGHWQGSDGMFTTEPWLDDFGHIPRSLHDEFAQAILQHGKKVEINIGGMLLTARYTERFKKQYLEYLAYLASKGVPLSIGSDCHSPHYESVDFEKAAAMLDSVGIGERNLWTLPPRAVL